MDMNVIDNLVVLLNRRCGRLENLISKSDKICDSRVQISRSKKGVPRFFLVEGGRKKRKYIRKDQVQAVASPVIQLDYARKQLRTDRKRIWLLNQLRALDDGEVLPGFDPDRRALIKPDPLVCDREAPEWVARSLSKYGFELEPRYRARGDHPFRSDAGVYVRSKIELIIANKLFSKGVTFYYEMAIWNGETYRVPDFIVVNKRSGAVIIYEHFGMLDDEGYRKEMLAKLDFYAKSGMSQGNGLVYTMEQKDHPLEMEVLDDFIKTHFL